MQIKYNNLDISFSLDGYIFYALNIVFEQFLGTIPRHSHSAGSYELHYIPYGHGKVFLRDVPYELCDNSLYVTGPHIEHEQYTDALNPIAEYCIYLRVQKERCSLPKYKDPIAEHFINTPLWIGKDTQNMRYVMQRLFTELQDKKTGYMPEVEILLKQCVISMVRNYETGSDISVRFPASNLFNSKSIILEECFLYEYSTLTLEQLAGRLCLSDRQTERMLKEQYGKTFQQKKTEARMSAASVLLQTSDKSITEISDHVGFSSIEHFSSAFRKYSGMTAREYRNTCHSEEKY